MSKFIKLHYDDGVAMIVPVDRIISVIDRVLTSPHGPQTITTLELADQGGGKHTFQIDESADIVFKFFV